MALLKQVLERKFTKIFQLFEKRFVGLNSIVIVDIFTFIGQRQIKSGSRKFTDVSDSQKTNSLTVTHVDMPQ